MRITSSLTRAQGVLIAASAVVFLVLTDRFVNFPLRSALRDAIGGPAWIDELILVQLGNVVLAAVLGLILLDRREAFLALPHRLVRASLVGIAVGLALVAIAAIGLLTMKINLTIHPRISAVLLGIVSISYEEVIYRGVLLGILAKYLRSTSLAVVISAAVFVQGQLGRVPMQLTALSFSIGLACGALAVKYRSLLPGYLARITYAVVTAALFALKK